MCSPSRPHPPRGESAFLHFVCIVSAIMGFSRISVSARRSRSRRSKARQEGERKGGRRRKGEMRERRQCEADKKKKTRKKFCLHTDARLTDMINV